MSHKRFRVSYTLRDQTTPDAHCFGVNTLLLDSSGILYTGGRDSSVRSWSTLGEIAHHHLYQGHTDWVNDLAFVPQNKSRLFFFFI